MSDLIKSAPRFKLKDEKLNQYVEEYYWAVRGDGKLLILAPYEDKTIPEGSFFNAFFQYPEDASRYTLEKQ